MRFTYRLAITTDGREGLLDRTLAAFFAKVTPQPTIIDVVDDSADPDYRRYLEALCDSLAGCVDAGVHLLSHPARRGFCETVGDAWKLAGGHADYISPDEPEWVYWLEDDFVHLRALDLRDVAFVLERERQLAQMVLYRNPVSPEEQAAGGYLNLRPETYAKRGGKTPWWEHRNFWSTNPALFRSAIPATYPWPGTEKFCEGMFGIWLLEQRPDTTFGIWGAGEPWVEHIGVRSGTGY